MGIARALRRLQRRSEPQVGPALSTLTSQVEELADNLFEAMLLSGEPMPTRASVEGDVKATFMSTLDPFMQGAVADGTAPAEVRSCFDLLTSHVQVAFQARWAVLEDRHRKLTTANGAGMTAH